MKHRNKSYQHTLVYDDNTTRDECKGKKIVEQNVFSMRSSQDIVAINLIFYPIWSHHPTKFR